MNKERNRRLKKSKQRRHGKPEFTNDYVILIVTSILLALGLLLLSSATSIIAFEQTGDSYFYLKQQVIRGLIPGIILLYFASRFDYRLYRRFATIIIIAVFFLLLVVHVPGIGEVRNGVASWAGIGSIVFQTSELAKLLFIIWLSVWLSRKSKVIKNFKKTTLPFMLILGAVAASLMLQPDAGTMMIYVAIALSLFLASNASLLHIGLIIGAGIASLVPIVIAAPYRLQRLMTFWNPEADIQGSGYQVYQSLLAIGSGFLFGAGIGQSRQKFYYLPEIASDSIFAIIGEELGFVFSIFIILMFGVLVWRGIRISKDAPDILGSLMALGITVLIAFHVLINIGSMLGLLPLTGVPLPFISLGGTHLVIVLAGIGILNNISKQSQHNA